MAMKAKEVVEIIPPKKIFVGNPQAPVTLMEFGEYENEDCAKANEVVKKLLKEFGEKLRFNFRHFPLTKIHQRSMKAGEAAVGAAQEGKFWEMHNILFENRRQLGTISLKMYAKEAGVINKNFLTQLVDSTYGWQVHSDHLEGVEKGVKNIPAFFINGELYTGKVTFVELRKAIESALTKAKVKPLSKQKRA
jgi:protein-disulfide isomerase